jgi:hypothetical protein
MHVYLIGIGIITTACVFCAGYWTAAKFGTQVQKDIALLRADVQHLTATLRGDEHSAVASLEAVGAEIQKL